MRGEKGAESWNSAPEGTTTFFLQMKIGDFWSVGVSVCLDVLNLEAYRDLCVRMSV